MRRCFFRSFLLARSASDKALAKRTDVPLEAAVLSGGADEATFSSAPDMGSASSSLGSRAKPFGPKTSESAPVLFRLLFFLE